MSSVHACACLCMLRQLSLACLAGQSSGHCAVATSKRRGWPLRRMSRVALSPVYFMDSRKLSAIRSPCLPPTPAQLAPRSKC